jgi:hypothetical protein
MDAALEHVPHRVHDRGGDRIGKLIGNLHGPTPSPERVTYDAALFLKPRNLCRDFSQGDDNPLGVLARGGEVGIISPLFIRNVSALVLYPLCRRGDRSTRDIKEAIVHA